MQSNTRCYLLLNITIIATTSRVSRAVLGGPCHPHSSGKKGHTQLLQSCKLLMIEESSDSYFLEIASGD